MISGIYQIVNMINGREGAPDHESLSAASKVREARKKEKRLGLPFP